MEIKGEFKGEREEERDQEVLDDEVNANNEDEHQHRLWL